MTWSLLQLDNAVSTAAISQKRLAIWSAATHVLPPTGETRRLSVALGLQAVQTKFARLQAARATVGDFINLIAAVKTAFIFHFLCQLSQSWSLVE